MRCLLDTHIFIWWMLDSKLLKQSFREIIENPKNEMVLSVVSIWELIIKKRLGKFKFPPRWKTTLEESGFNVLQIDLNHIYHLDFLPLYHNDPFDRILIAQAKFENLTIITADSKFTKYKVKIVI